VALPLRLRALHWDYRGSCAPIAIGLKRSVLPEWREIAVALTPSDQVATGWLVGYASITKLGRFAYDLPLVTGIAAGDHTIR
jgi:hypothetical protein